ncbi:protein FAM216A-like isoform X2 [Oryzias latipes]|uniref:protein FAM216A-like isoform X2 n=1 Tax=Oryzias latipes TaxID=8090 RepID=UPI000CE24BAF|nr:protein FAM216A-like isoform X2 [Oryzias latipes]
MCAGSSCRPDQQVKAQYKETATDLCGDRLLKTLLAPITVTSATFLQQVLTAGQKSHICSAANMCSTERMRWQMKKHYLNVLHACIQSGQSDPCKRKHVDQNRTLTKDVQKDTWWTNKPQPQRECRKRAHSDLVLPKISKR